MNSWNYRNRKRPKGVEFDPKVLKPFGIKGVVVPFGSPAHKKKKKEDGDGHRDEVRRDES